MAGFRSRRNYPENSLLREFGDGEVEVGGGGVFPLLVGADAPGAMVKPDPQQGDLFRPEARQLRFEMSTAAAANGVRINP